MLHVSKLSIIIENISIVGKIIYFDIILFICILIFLARRSIYLETQHPDGLEKIRELEAQGRPAKLEIDEPPPTAPTLTELWVSNNGYLYTILLN